MHEDRDRSARLGRLLWAGLAFVLVAFGVLWLAAQRYLLPAVQAAKEATRPEKDRLAAVSALVMVLVLVVLLGALLVLFRVSRFFLPRPNQPRKPTRYPDAWEESARRMPTPPEDGDA